MVQSLTGTIEDHLNEISIGRFNEVRSQDRTGISVKVECRNIHDTCIELLIISLPHSLFFGSNTHDPGTTRCIDDFAPIFKVYPFPVHTYDTKRLDFDIAIEQIGTWGSSITAVGMSAELVCLGQHDTRCHGCSLISVLD
jgi:hypothetical protein